MLVTQASETNLEFQNVKIIAECEKQIRTQRRSLSNGDSEIMNVSSLETVHSSWERTTLLHEQAMMWTKSASIRLLGFRAVLVRIEQSY